MVGFGVASSGMSVDDYLAVDALGITMTPAKTGPAKSIDARHSRGADAEKEIWASRNCWVCRTCFVDFRVRLDWRVVVPPP
jgi:hypothetical protein